MITAQESIALLLAIASGVVIPALSALLTKFPGWWTGVCTVALSVVAGLVGEAAADGSAFNWSHGLATAIQTFAVAVLAHKSIWAKTSVIAKLHATGPIKR